MQMQFSWLTRFMLVAALSATAAACGSSSTEPNPAQPVATRTDWTRLNLKGRVKTIREQTTAGNAERRFEMLQTSNFNGEGYLTDITKYETGAPSRVETYQYQTPNQLTAILVQTPDKSSTLQTIRFIYNDKGSLQTELRLTGRDSTTCAYDDKGNRIACRNQVTDEKYSYNDKNQLISSTLNMAGMSFTHQYTYNELGDILTSQTIQADGTTTETEYSYEYDEQKNWLSRVVRVDGSILATESRELMYHD